MSIALYREYRPKTFDEIYDQNFVVEALRNQVISHNIGHAYLFSGTRGTGKTSSARIFGRAINCLNPHNGSPCNECVNCKAILSESTADFVEMDAASNRGIDNIRELKNDVLYPPTLLKYKVYIIDEAHMITTEAFNAFLKVLEEPPKNTVFILATTVEEKIPKTILSRLQRYEFKRINIVDIEDNIKKIAQEKKVAIDDDAVREIAIGADGAMRDALSILDQVLSYNLDKITIVDVNKILGNSDKDNLYSLLNSIFDNDILSSINIFKETISEGTDTYSLFKDLVEMFRKILILKVSKEEISLDDDPITLKRLYDISKKADLSRILDSIDILIESENMMKKSDFRQAVFENTLVKLVRYINFKDLFSRVKALEDKLINIQRFQVPENIIRDEVRQLYYKDISNLPNNQKVPDNSTFNKNIDDVVSNEIIQQECNSNELDMNPIFLEKDSNKSMNIYEVINNFKTDICRDINEIFPLFESDYKGIDVKDSTVIFYVDKIYNLLNKEDKVSKIKDILLKYFSKIGIDSYDYEVLIKKSTSHIDDKNNEFIYNNVVEAISHDEIADNKSINNSKIIRLKDIFGDKLFIQD